MLSCLGENIVVRKKKPKPLASKLRKSMNFMMVTRLLGDFLTREGRRIVKSRRRRTEHSQL